ncbi:MAG: YitT family protein [Lachnospiraceae bacterium]
MKKYSIITIACFFYGVGVSLFFNPNRIAPGGVTGIAVILSQLIPVRVGTLLLVLNIPILGVGLYKFGLKFLYSTIYATIMVSIFTDLLSYFKPLTTDPLLAVIIGGSLIASSLAVIFKTGATTGGADIIVKLLRLKYQYLKTGRLFLIVDFIVVLSSGLILQNLNIAMYGIIGVFVMSIVMDGVLYGRDGAKLIYIISDVSSEIADRLISEVNIGVTFLHGTGAYSKKNKNIIMCIMRKQTSPHVEAIVKEVDPGAFFIISSAAEIYGEGFKDILEEKI